MSQKVKGIFEKIPGSGVWWVRYSDGVRIRRERVGPKSAAIKLYQKRKTEILQGIKLPENFRRKIVTFGELADDALEYSNSHKRSCRIDKCRMKPLKDEFGRRKAESITPLELERWLSDTADENGWAPATVNRYKALLSLTFSLGMKNGKVKNNPAKLVVRRLENNDRIRFLSNDEEKALRDVIWRDFPEHMPEIDVALNTGIRSSEQYRLTWDCVDFDNRVLTLILTKNGDTRHVPLNTAALSAFSQLKERSSGSPFVFLNGRNEPRCSSRNWFETAVDVAKVQDFTWHCLRHTFASRLVMKGVDLRTVQELLGHKTITMTLRYSHLAPQHKLAAVERLCMTSEEEKPQEESTDTKTSTSNSEAPKEEALAVL